MRVCRSGGSDNTSKNEGLDGSAKFEKVLMSPKPAVCIWKFYVIFLCVWINAWDYQSIACIINRIVEEQRWVHAIVCADHEVKREWVEAIILAIRFLQEYERCLRNSTATSSRLCLLNQRAIQ